MALAYPQILNGILKKNNNNLKAFGYAYKIKMSIWSLPIQFLDLSLGIATYAHPVNEVERQNLSKLVFTLISLLYGIQIVI
jgi:hypothetical protein